MRYTAVFEVDDHKEKRPKTIRESYCEETDLGAITRVLAYMAVLGKNHMCPFEEETTNIKLLSLSDQNRRELPQETLFKGLVFEPSARSPIKRKYAKIQDGKIVASFSGIESILLQEAALG